MAWSSILHALWLFLPAYVANMSPVLWAKVLPRWNAPIDGGRTDRKGRPILGPGKTWRGFFGGAVAGALTAVVLALVAAPEGTSGFFAGWDYGLGGHTTAATPPCGDTAPDCDGSTPPGSPLWAVALFGALMGFSALTGDAVKSYFKRRMGRPRGAPWVPFDQLDFVVFGVAAMFLGAPLLADGWVVDALLSDWVVLVTLFVLTPLLHFLVNVIGYWLKLKEVPW